jgi:hypothetical protein
MKIVNEILSFTEAKKRKAGFGNSEGFSSAVLIDGLDSNEFFKAPFGRQLGDLKKVKDWKASQGVKTDHVGAKGKSTMAAVKAWVKSVKPTEFYARWKQDSSNYKDDSVEIFYKK